MGEIRKLQKKYSFKDTYIRAWCDDCEIKWEGEQGKKEAYQHAHRTGHRVIVQIEIEIIYN